MFFEVIRGSGLVGIAGQRRTRVLVYPEFEQIIPESLF